MLWLHQRTLHWMLEWTKLHFFVHGFTKNASKHISFAQNCYKSLFLYMSPYMLFGIIVAQPADMQYIVLFLNISNRETKRHIRSIDTVVDNLARYQTDITGVCMYHWTFCTSCSWIGLSSTSFHITADSSGACGQFQTSIWKRRQ